MNYPGIFRKIYGQETEGRNGIFCVIRDAATGLFQNSAEFLGFVQSQPEPAGFLLAQLFDVSSLQLNDLGTLEERFLRSRACFNSRSSRNLEFYLKLLVRFARPEPQQTYVLYSNAVMRFINGIDSIESILESPDFDIRTKANAHDHFWRLLVKESFVFNERNGADAIDSLINMLPSYSAVEFGSGGLRQRGVYTLVRLLDRAGWGNAESRRRSESSADTVQIAWRIFGEESFAGRGVLARLVSPDRGAVGWFDVMLFRLQCCADRQGQLNNLYGALLIHQDPNACLAGQVSAIARSEMREMSQQIFGLFREAYIVPARNFFADVDEIEDFFILGAQEIEFEIADGVGPDARHDPASSAFQLLAKRSFLKSFVIYQLCNSKDSNRAGIGCGFFDTVGCLDRHTIANEMNSYVFDICFNPEVFDLNLRYFLDFTLTTFVRPLFSDVDNVGGYLPSKSEISGGLDSSRIVAYWRQHAGRLRSFAAANSSRIVYNQNYVATYATDLAKVFDVLDELVVGATLESQQMLLAPV